MSAGNLNLEELEAQAVLADAACKSIAITGTQETTTPRDRLLQVLGQAFWSFVQPYCAITCIAERAVNSGRFDRMMFGKLYERCGPFEGRADELLTVARSRDYFEHTVTGAPLLALEACNERLKDCMAALEAMLDPQLDARMASALEEHQRGETVPLDSIN